jgi:hypothetical protein
MAYKIKNIRDSSPKAMREVFSYSTIARLDVD